MHTLDLPRLVETHQSNQQPITSELLKVENFKKSKARFPFQNSIFDGLFPRKFQKRERNSLTQVITLVITQNKTKIKPWHFRGKKEKSCFWNIETLPHPAPILDIASKHYLFASNRCSYISLSCKRNPFPFWVQSAIKIHSCSRLPLTCPCALVTSWPVTPWRLETALPKACELAREPMAAAAAAAWLARGLLTSCKERKDQGENHHEAG